MNRDSKDRAGEIAHDFRDLKARLAALVRTGDPTDENLHFAAFRTVNESILAELTRLAHEGRSRVDDHQEYFLRHALYDDGMFWYELFLAISAAVLSYESSTGDRLQARQVEALLIELVLISRYATVHGGDITKRNHEALGNLLLAAYDESLVNLVRGKVRSLDEDRVAQFINQTLDRVDAIRQEKRSAGAHSEPRTENE
jgi:hypothetical protein